MRCEYGEHDKGHDNELGLCGVCHRFPDTRPKVPVRKVCGSCDYSRGMGGGNPNKLYCRGFGQEVNVNHTCEAFNGSVRITQVLDNGGIPQLVEK